MVEFLIGFLKMNDVEYAENRLLRDFSSVGIGGMAPIIAFPDNTPKLCNIVCFLEKQKIKYKILGRMSNILPPDDDCSYAIIKTDKMSGFSIKDNKIVACAGTSLPYLTYKASREGLSGLEELSGIPGSLGGSILGNAGAFGREISDLVLSVTCYDSQNDKIITLSNGECDFSYRYSAFKENGLVILSAELSLISATGEKTKARIEEVRRARSLTQPVGEKSLGSTFKRTTDGISAAMLIDKCGLKGYSIGGAQISTKHAGFIVNTGLATASDYISLMKYTRRKVKEKFNIDLNEEIEIIK